ncbi:GNAT family N-acetyltransferase [Alkalihalobacillus sp. 1P02AB]|uniref:GNAT family N-acetyltransferase n=1 Tax=Alkalihalobacillus sp. 1P02AB TaxID=3132260 RepID=UPI0039A649B5
MKITFKHTFELGEIIFENELFSHYHFAKVKIIYDANFIEFKMMPSLEQFIVTETYLKEFHQKNKQEHVKFCFPENAVLSKEINEYWQQTDYSLAKRELYQIRAADFAGRTSTNSITVEQVNEHNLEDFLTLHYRFNSEYGDEFATGKNQVLKEQWEQEPFTFYLGYFEGKPAGFINAIQTKNVIEIENLHVVDDYQKRGIGHQLQMAVMKQFPDETVILIADGDDTPREMYQKQGYQYVGFMYEVLKTCDR